jgi:uncharacterized protein (TIGR03067 family)
MTGARRFAWVLTLGLACVTAWSVGGAPRSKDPREEKLEGNWRQTHVEFEGTDQNAGERPQRNHWVITRDTITIWTIQGHSGGWSYRLDPSKRPATIDLTTTAGGKEVTYPCIYKLDGDELTVCLQNYPEKGRPQSFESKPSSGIGKFIYVRAKPGDEKALAQGKPKDKQ